MKKTVAKEDKSIRGIRETKNPEIALQWKPENALTTKN